MTCQVQDIVPTPPRMRPLFLIPFGRAKIPVPTFPTEIYKDTVCPGSSDPPAKNI